MKKRDIKLRLVSLFRSMKEYFIEEEPREKAQRTLKEASIRLNKTVYQRLSLEYELEHKDLDDEARAWTQRTLDTLRQTEHQYSSQLAMLRDEYRKLAVQDLLYRAMNEPDGDAFEKAHDALIELSATVEAERNIQTFPKLLSMRPSRPPTGLLAASPQDRPSHDQ